MVRLRDEGEFKLTIKADPLEELKLLRNLVVSREMEGGINKEEIRDRIMDLTVKVMNGYNTDKHYAYDYLHHFSINYNGLVKEGVFSQSGTDFVKMVLKIKNFQMVFTRFAVESNIFIRYLNPINRRNFIKIGVKKGFLPREFAKEEMIDKVIDECDTIFQIGNKDYKDPSSIRDFETTVFTESDFPSLKKFKVQQYIANFDLFQYIRTSIEGFVKGGNNLVILDEDDEITEITTEDMGDHFKCDPVFIETLQEYFVKESNKKRSPNLINFRNQRNKPTFSYYAQDDKENVEAMFNLIYDKIFTDELLQNNSQILVKFMEADLTYEEEK